MHETFEHTADLGIRVRAETLGQLFAEGARALTGVLVGDPDAEPAERLETVDLQAPLPDLFFDWLSELVYLFSVRRFVAREVRIDATESSIRASLRGWTFDPDRHAGGHEVKAVTYHELKVEREGGGWFAQVILDI